MQLINIKQFNDFHLVPGVTFGRHIPALSSFGTDKLTYLWHLLDEAGYVDSGRGGEKSKDTFAVVYVKSRSPDG